MGLFDWVPTVDEVIDFVECRLMGHQWREGRCTVCGKKRE